VTESDAAEAAGAFQLNFHDLLVLEDCVKYDRPPDDIIFVPVAAIYVPIDAFAGLRTTN